MIPRWLEIVVFALSVVMFVGSLALVPIALVRLPPDHFARPHAKHALVTRIVRNVLGAALIFLGAAMLVMPGQGVLTILVGIGVLDLPFKQRIARRILCNDRVRRAVDDLRVRAGRPPLVVPSPGKC